MRPNQNCKVRFPEPGEVLRIDALEPWSLWYPVHSRGGRPAPCLGQECPLCHGARRAGSHRWEGYLLCRETAAHCKSFVLRLTPSVWWNTLNRASWPYDLRCWILQVERLRLGGRPSLRAQLVCQLSQEGAVEPFVSQVPFWLSDFWDLASFPAAARSEVYRMDGLIGPGFQFPAVSGPVPFETREENAT